MSNPIKKFRQFLKEAQIDKWIVFFFLIYLVLLIKLITIKEIETSTIFSIYSILVTGYILYRLLLSAFYSPHITINSQYLPSVTFVTPARNEEDNIAQTLRLMLKSDYPKDKIEIVVFNDGSTDNTLKEMQKVKAEADKLDIEMKVIDSKWVGKREGMAKGIRESSHEIIIFIDSDSFIELDTISELVKYFADPRIGVVAGHTDVYNRETNLLTKMQAVGYYISFQVHKSAESIFGNVMCCSGCCSAYRKEYLLEILEKWRNQTFLGVKCTYGDDRSLTNFVLRKYKAVYASQAHAATVVPDKWRKYFKQQLRWKKSWTRENLIASTFMWKRNPLMTISFFLGLILPLMAPVVVIRALFWVPYTQGVIPWFYVSGLILMSTIYGLYYLIRRKDKLWIYGVLFSWFYSLILIWQLPYAILNLRDSKWGTR